MLGHINLTATELDTRVSINLLRQAYSRRPPEAAGKPGQPRRGISRPKRRCSTRRAIPDRPASSPAFCTPGGMPPSAAASG
jgi:hypothetical protein